MVPFSVVLCLDTDLNLLVYIEKTNILVWLLGGNIVGSSAVLL